MNNSMTPVLNYTLTLFACLTLMLGCKESPTPKPTQEKATPKSISKATPTAPPKVLKEATMDLTKYGIANSPDNVLGGLKVGDTAPDFTLEDHTGVNVNLYNLTEEGPVVVVFYRAHWCGYCTKSLADMQADLATLKAKGASVLAISPEQTKWAKQVAEDKGLAYPLLHDGGHKVSKAYKTFFNVTPQYDEKLANALEKNIADVNGDASSMMPVPATYVIGVDQKIKYVFYNPDYSQRANVNDVMAAL